ARCRRLHPRRCRIWLAGAAHDLALGARPGAIWLHRRVGRADEARLRTHSHSLPSAAGSRRMPMTPPPSSSGTPDAAAWATNSTLAELAEWIRTRKRIVILTHVKPDGDAVGSTIGVARAINLASKTGGEYRPAKATPWFWGPQPDWF